MTTTSEGAAQLDAQLDAPPATEPAALHRMLTNGSGKP